MILRNRTGLNLSFGHSRKYDDMTCYSGVSGIKPDSTIEMIVDEDNPKRALFPYIEENETGKWLCASSTDYLRWDHDIENYYFILGNDVNCPNVQRGDIVLPEVFHKLNQSEREGVFTIRPIGNNWYNLIHG